MAQQREGGADTGAAGRAPLSDIIGSVIQNLQTIFRAEVRLAGVELKEKFRQSVKAGILLSGAGVLGLLAAMCFVTTCIVALAIVLPLWLSALLIGVVLAFGAGGAYMLGRLALEEVDPVPQQTVETLRDLVDWSKTRTK